MHTPRVIPCLLIKGNGLYKTRKFKNPVYVGDPVNVIRIFNEKEVDEIVLLDIDASVKGQLPNYQLIEEMASEAFMPIAYGGGVTTLEQARKLIRLGVEKIVINSFNAISTKLVSEMSEVFGCQAVVGAVDVKKNILGQYHVYIKSASEKIKYSLEAHIQKLVQAGVGEIFINNIDHDGMMGGYDLQLIRNVVNIVKIPVVACGGAGEFEHLSQAINEGGASAVAAGSMFVFYGKHKAVLINYPTGRSLICDEK